MIEMNDPKIQSQLPINDTRASILTYLLSDDLTAIDLEDKLGINESAVRRHLDTLEQKGYVEHYFEKASRGRPKKSYRITSEGREIFPQRTHQLFILLAEVVKEEQGEKQLEKLLSGVASKFAERLSPKESSFSKEDQLEEFVNSLEKFGFFPYLSKMKNGNYQIKYGNCVFGGVADEFSGRLCKMHQEIVKKAISGCSVALEKSRAEGDNVCIHRIELEGE